MAPATAAELAEAYRPLRAVEHRVQMLADEQTHRLPEADAERAARRGARRLRPAAQLRRGGHPHAEGRQRPLRRALPRGGAAVLALRQPGVHRRRGRSGDAGDAEADGLLQPGAGRRRPSAAGTTATSPPPRTERGRELFTRLAPRLLDAAQATGAPDAAFNRFADFFSRPVLGRAGAVAVPGPAASSSSWSSR